MERISTVEAGRRLGVSPTQVRRMIAGGKLRSETQHRPQGTRLVVLWDAPHVATEDATQTHRDAPERPHDAPGVATEDATEVAWLRARLVAAEEANAELRRLLALALQVQQIPASTQQVDATGTPPQETIVARRGWARLAFWRA